MTTRQRNLSILYSSMLVASRPRVLVELPSTTTLHELLNGFVKRAIESENELQLRASLHAVASLVNKHHGSSSSSSSGGGGGGGGQTIESWLDDDDGELKKVWNTYLGGGRTDRDVSDEDDDATTRLSKRRKALRVWTWVSFFLSSLSSSFFFGNSSCWRPPFSSFGVVCAGFCVWWAGHESIDREVRRERVRHGRTLVKTL